MKKDKSKTRSKKLKSDKNKHPRSKTNHEPNIDDFVAQAKVMTTGLLNELASEGEIPADGLEYLQSYFDARILQIKSELDATPDMVLPKPTVEAFEEANDIVDFTRFELDHGNGILYQAANDEVIKRAPATLGGFLEHTPVQVEVAIEAIAMAIGALAGRLPARGKKAIKEMVEDVSENNWFKRLMKGLLAHLRDRSMPLKEWLKELGGFLKALFDQLKRRLKKLFEDIFENLKWWEIIILVGEFLLSFLPFAWVKKMGALTIGFTAVAYQLKEKWDKYEAGTLDAKPA